MKGWLLWAGIGALCVLGTAWGFRNIGGGGIALRLAPGGGKLALRFINPGKRDVVIDAEGMELFVYAPDDGSRRYLLQAESGGQANRGGVVVPAGGSVEVGNALPLLRGLPEGRLGGVYVAAGGDSSFWRGVVHSPDVPLEQR